MTAPPSAAEFTVLVVCTGNICRSPMGERQIRAGIDAAIPAQAHRFAVISAGTYSGHRGEPMQPGARHVLSERGIPDHGFAATPLDESVLASADLVLTAERSHRTVAVRMLPMALPQTFTVIEFGRLLDGASQDPMLQQSRPLDPVERARMLVELAAERRSTAPPPVPPSSDDIDDPYAQPVEAFRRTADEIDRAITGWIRMLRPAS
jgi:protein-tyrosine phosphatase